MGFTDQGKILAMDVDLYNNAGCSLDLSAAVMDRALMHCENSYRIPNVRAVGHVCRTHVASNTAFRGFGGPQVFSRLPHPTRTFSLQSSGSEFACSVIL